MICCSNERSGSTLVQRIFNARNKSLLWGEQNGALNDIIKSYDTFLEGLLIKGGDNERNAFIESGKNPNMWIGMMMPDVHHIEQAYIHSIRTLFSTMYQQYREQHDLIGFKEHRYGRKEIELLRKSFPETDFLLLVRDPIKSWKSIPKDWISIKEFVNKWNEHTTYFLEVQNEKKMHLVRYEDVTSKKPETIRIISELGRLSFDEIDDVLGEKIGSTSKKIYEVEEQFIIENCSINMKKLNYI